MTTETLAAPRARGLPDALLRYLYGNSEIEQCQGNKEKQINRVPIAIEEQRQQH